MSTQAGAPRVLYVCTANISRSPYAHYRTLHLFGGQLEAGSAGVPGVVGRPMDPTMEAALPRVDRAVMQHQSRSLTSEDLSESDLILTMEFGHHMRILELWPHSRDRVFGIRQFVAGLSGVQAGGSPAEALAVALTRIPTNSTMLDIADPYGRGRVVARRCAKELDDLVLRLGVGLGYQPVSEHET